MFMRPSRHQPSPEESVKVARTQVVSWLRAALLAFPTRRQWRCVSRRVCPIQWRGRTGISPVSVSRVRNQLFANLRSGVVRQQAELGSDPNCPSKWGLTPIS